jgi:CCR4-NOT transcription complex subunit 7/8
LVKLLTASSLPTNENDFFDALNTWFPVSFDVKYIMKASKVLKGGLQDVADDLGVIQPYFRIPFFN